MKRKLIVGFLTICSIATVCPSVYASTDHYTDSSVTGADSGWSDWDANWADTAADFTKVSLTPGADDTPLNFAWYSEKSDSAATPVVHFGTDKDNLETFEGTAGDVDQELTGDKAYEYNHVTVTGLEPETTYYYTVEKNESGTRIDRYLAEKDSGFSRSFIQKLLKDGQVTVGGKPAKSNYKVREDDSIHLEVPDSSEPDIVPEDIPLDILYEDEDVLIVNKPKGMVVHPAAGHYQGTLVNAVMAHCGDSLSGINGVMRPGIVHRIDKDTTGALLVCKNDTAHRDLAEQLKCHSIRRRYRAVVQGNLKEDEGTIEGPIGRHPTDRKKMAINYKNGKDAVTHYKVLERFGQATYVECRLETGRTHQIRVHMASIGHPLLGDTVYGSSKNPYHLEGQALHAMILGFVHPRTCEYMEFTAPLPEYFVKLLSKLRK